MGKSKLTTVTKISPHSRPRDRKPDAIMIHHMALKATAEACGAAFQPRTANASTHYGIGFDGSVGSYVDEDLAAKSCGHRETNDRAITIEVSNDSRWPDWHVPDVALEKLVELCVDICLRQGFPALVYTGDLSGNLLLHKMVEPTGCPGPYLESKIPWIAEEVTRRLRLIRGLKPPRGLRDNDEQAKAEPAGISRVLFREY